MNFHSRAEVIIGKLFHLFLSQKSRFWGERAILIVAISSYLAHLLLILLVHFGFVTAESRFLTSPISAIYTPFSFILVYEVYLLIFYLPKSTSFYIGKQYEIITLIVIRRIFKDIGTLELSLPWFENDHDLQFTYDVVTSLIIYSLIYLFYHKILKREPVQQETSGQLEKKTSDFILLKKSISILLVPMMLLLALYSFWNWIEAASMDYLSGIDALINVNNIFFEEFFTILISVDVLILLASFFYSDKFHTIIRNSGFVISTILIKVSFSVEGILNNILIVGAVVFGLLIMYIHSQFEEKETIRSK
ncbi:MAG: hypothetical protein FJZ78_08910 [Bacteroidetes bacterium]|nr:hypothetical protein [Bacteroidota bacterium]